MIEFIDKTVNENGTPINRFNLMALQGFISSTINFKDDGSIEEVNANGETKTTIVNDDGSITETFVGKIIITKTTHFRENGTVEVIA